MRETRVKWLGRSGYAARGVVFLIAGLFAGKAALADRSSGVAGIGQALDWLASPIDLIVAGGLMLFGVYGLVESRYRRIRTPDPVQLASRAAAQLR